MTLSRLLFVDGTPEQLQAYCGDRLELDVNREHAVAVLAITGGRPRCGRYELDDAALMVLKNILQRFGYFENVQPPDKNEAVLYPHHFFFIALAETEEMLQRLRYEPRYVSNCVVARSKICDTVQIIQPIDAVAYRVSRGD